MTAGAGVSSGYQIGARGEGHATYNDGVISFGLSGDLALLLGIKLDFNIEIDIGEFTDAVKDVVDFFGNDVTDFLSEDVADFFANDFVDFYDNVFNPSNWW